jgi:molybdopterin/thiamine biosynthesis adenylyltransferase
MLVNLLARQYGVVDNIFLDIPRAESLVGVFPLRVNPASFPERLLKLAWDVAGPEIQVSHWKSESLSRIAGENLAVINLGTVDTKIESECVISVAADGWRFACSTEDALDVSASSHANPIGPYMAACFAASAVFRHFIGQDPRTEIAYGLWDGAEGRWSELKPGISLGEVVLPPVYIIGTGAVGTAAAFALAASREIRGNLILIDPKKSTITNKNRLLSTRYADPERAKVLLAADLFYESQIQCYPYFGAWPDYTIAEGRCTPDNIVAIERCDRYEWVLSCVERNHQRRGIALLYPGNVLGGSTNGMRAQVAYYSMGGACQCLGCDHPIPRTPSVEELSDELRSMNQEQRRDWYFRYGVGERESAAIEEYLHDPACGRAGAHELGLLSSSGEVDWSVGFVSVASGVLLVASLIRLLLGRDDFLQRGSELHAWFLKPSLGQHFAKRKSDCEICSSAEKQARFHEIWRS